MHRWLVLSALAPLTACQSEPELATLTDGSPQTTEIVTRVLASAVGRASIQLGPADMTVEPVVSVLPPPPGLYEGNSPAFPSLFDIVLQDGDCYVRSQASGEMYLLSGLGCVPVSRTP